MINILAKYLSSIKVELMDDLWRSLERLLDLPLYPSVAGYQDLLCSWWAVCDRPGILQIIIKTVIHCSHTVFTYWPLISIAFNLHKISAKERLLVSFYDQGIIRDCVVLPKMAC
jgi:hypothetical protein